MNLPVGAPPQPPVQARRYLLRPWSRPRDAAYSGTVSGRRPVAARAPLPQTVDPSIRGHWLLLTLLAALLVAGPAGAKHDWVGLDLCRAYPERMPPELDSAAFPQPDSDGARLVIGFCSQCHFAPAPGQHTAGQWADVLERMALLMDVTARFGDRPRPILSPDPTERATLLAYLQGQALRPLADQTQAPPAYRDLCSDCHAAPDPAGYPEADWPILLARMDLHRVAMRRPPADPTARATVAAYLGVPGAPTPEQAPTAPAEGQPGISAHLARWLALGPILLLTMIGLARWWLGREGRQ